ncbi:MAG: hypothetical protein AAF204_01780, partial [Pseudomonadota bacterium]
MDVLKHILSTICIVVFVLTLCAGAAKFYIEGQADKKLESFTQDVAKYEKPSAFMLNATLHVFNLFNEGNEKFSPHFLSNLEPVLTSKYLPEIIRTQKGAIDTMQPEFGNEMSAARMLGYVLAKRDIKSIPWRILSPRGLKTGVVADLNDGAYRYLDPADGVVAMYDNKVLIGPYAAREVMMDDLDHRELFVKLIEEADQSFYEGFAHTMMAPPGSKLYVNVVAPVFEEPLVLGALDGNSDDVAAASSEVSLTPFFDYLGQKYDAGIQRKMNFTEAAKVTITLADNYDEALLTS